MTTETPVVKGPPRRAQAAVSDEPPAVPHKDPNFVPYGSYYEDLSTIIKSAKFYPVMVTGLSGNGKTKTVEQVCADNNRNMCRINITCETDEDDLIGGFRLIDGQTVFNYGPVVEAMLHGSVLLIDEIDLASNRIMCLQSILEGNPIHIKRINQKIYPKPGFNIIATANTKGQGNESGKFVGTNVMNEAFLDRFPFMVEHDYPPMDIERKILELKLKNAGVPIDDFAKCLVQWAEKNRQAFRDSQTDDVITTRRLLHIIEAYTIFAGKPGARAYSVRKCLSRFNSETQDSLFKMYQNIDTNALSEEQQRKLREMAEKTRNIKSWNP